MKEFVVTKEQQGKRLDVFMGEVAGWPRSLVMRAWRTKKLKVNGKKEALSYRLQAGDRVVSYVLEKKQAHFSLVYEDDRLLIVDKEAGLLALDTTGGTHHTLLDEVNAYLNEKGEAPAHMVHRIDFHTSGLMVIAKTAEMKRILDEVIQNRELVKTYLAISLGRWKKEAGTLTHYLFKDAKQNRVFLSETPVKGGKTAITDYRVLSYKEGLSLVECRLHTGRTHQIRSQLAYMGHPLLGDDKYGNKEINKKYKVRGQLLCAARLAFTVPAGHPLADLNGTVFSVLRSPFGKKYFSYIKNSCQMKAYDVT